jgi:iron(III) transport system ATP-binding protein
MTALQIESLVKHFSADVAALSGISFVVAQGEILALVGPSGCGKTTTLRLIAGLERPTSGSILLNGQLVAGNGHFTPPEQRGIGLVFQEHALFPHLSVADNVAFGLRGLSASEARTRVHEMLTLVGLDGYASRYPHELSGGERQRVALARALAPRPVLLLMDEPFSSLDADLRLEMREQVRSILKTMHATAIFVTHDQEEAMYMGDRLAVFNKGHIEQIATPEEIFHIPQTHFVAEFMGNTDFLPGIITPEGIQTEIGLVAQSTGLPVGARVELAVRGDDISFDPAPGAPDAISERMFHGAYNVYRLQLPSGATLHSIQPHTRLLPRGQAVRVYVSAGHPLALFHEGKAVQLPSQ